MTPEDLRAVFIRRSARSGIRITPTLTAILANADGRACTEDRCEGDVRLTWAEGFGGDEIRCPARLRGGRCALVDGAARCVTDAVECTDGEAAGAEDLARFCVRGAWIELACAGFEGGTCVDESEPDRPALRCEITG